MRSDVLEKMQTIIDPINVHVSRRMLRMNRMNKNPLFVTSSLGPQGPHMDMIRHGSSP